MSYHNNDAVFESLQSLLNSDNLSTIIPTEIRCGGMTIRFIQSSDNRYVQYRLMSNEFTTDTTQWAIDDESVYTENPEFIYVKTDREGKILWAIKIDGGIYYGAGVPQQVIDYIEEKLAELSLDKCEDIAAFLNGLEEGDKTLQALLNEKVDKEEGKSLIEDEVKECFGIIENEEYLAVEQDAEGKVLSATHPDGSHYIHNVKSETIPTEFSHIEDPEGRMEITKDAEGKIIDFRDSEGYLHFVKLFVKELNIGENLCIKDTNDLYEIFKVFTHENKSISNYQFALPTHGNVNILKETFYLTSNSGYTDKDGVLPMMVYENTEENAEKGITVSKFYVKSKLKPYNHVIIL